MNLLTQTRRPPSYHLSFRLIDGLLILVLPFLFCLIFLLRLPLLLGLPFNICWVWNFCAASQSPGVGQMTDLKSTVDVFSMS